MAKMLKNHAGPEYDSKGLYMDGCSCCNPKQLRRSAKKRAKRREERQWKKDQDA